MKKQTNTELLIRIDERVRVLTTQMGKFCKKLDTHEVRIDDVERWQKDWNLRTKFIVGAASFIGGIVVFIVDKVWDFFKSRGS